MASGELLYFHFEGGLTLTRNKGKMMNICRILIITLTLSFLSGCISPKSYVDPKYNGISVSDIKTVEEKYNASIDIVFMRNGERYKRADQELRTRVENALVKSGVVTPSLDSEEISIKVVCNNIADLEEARAKGFGAGLTFGAKGTAVTDYYQVSIEMNQGGNIVKKVYDHALHTTIGNKAPPVEGTPSTPAEAFGGVIEDIVLQFIKDMQSSNILTLEEHSLIHKG